MPSRLVAAGVEVTDPLVRQSFLSLVDGDFWVRGWICTEPMANVTLTPQVLYELAVLPFVERARAMRVGGPDGFSLLEHGSWHGLYALELSAAFPRSSLIALEPDREAWARHSKLARAMRRRNVFVAHNALSDEVAEALAHSNEFVDAQLLLSLQSARSFDHGSEVRPSLLERLDGFIAHLLSLSRRTLLLLPAAPTPLCADNRLANWAHAAAGSGAGTGSGADTGSSAGAGEAIATRLTRAGAAIGLKLHSSRVLAGRALDGCDYEVRSTAAELALDGHSVAAR